LPLITAASVFSGAPSETLGQESKQEQSVLFQCNFEERDWWREWSLRELPNRTATVNTDPKLNFEPHDGKALRVRVDEGGHNGLSLAYRFAKQVGEEPESIYFQYHLRFASDWQPERGGKLPGIAGTYGRAGWGGRRVDGSDGWSARGLFDGQVDGKTPVGFYCYHADMKGKYGEHWHWDRGGFKGLKNNHWYRIEQYVELNSPGKNDGVLRAWVDDQLVFEKTDVRMRDVKHLKIENIWINIYYGGTWKAHRDYHLYIDDVTVSKSRIGS
jgi:hypothetical protein